MTPRDTTTIPPATTTEGERPTTALVPRCERPACPACGGALFEIRAKLQCAVCHVIVETCCEGGRG